MASIEVLNVSQQNPEDPVEIQLSTSNIIYRGPAGHDGIIGHDGKSAYEIAVENGFEGTEVEWLMSLQGEPGQDGSVGPQGPAGDTPIKGVDYFTQQDIAAIAAQVPTADLSGYSKVISIAISEALTGDKATALQTVQTELVNGTYDYRYNIWFNGSLAYPVRNIRSSAVYPDLLIFNKSGYYFKYSPDFVNDQSFYVSGQPIDLQGAHISISSNNCVSPTSTVLDAQFGYIKGQYASKAYVEEAIRGAESGLLKRSVVQTLPNSDIDEDTIYMVPKTGSAGDVYDEYLYINSTWEHIGNTSVDLTNYALKSELFSGDYDDLINKPTIPSPYILPNATTATLGGVMVDGSTITVDSNGVISSSSGASYTAGNGIDIDSNNVIDLLNNRTSFVPILYSILTRNSGMVRQDGSIQALWNNRFSRANLTYHIDNLKTWRMTYFSDGLVVATWRALVEALEGPIENLNNAVPYRFPSTQQADQYTYIMAQASAPLADNSRFNMANQPVLVEYIPDANVKWVFISYPERLFQNTYFNSQQGLTSHSIAAAIDEVAGQVGAKLTAPTAPSADGSYILKCGVSSGTPTYSWESVVIGGSY